MIETVIMIPIFILVWACIVYAYQAYEHRIEMMQRTRADAWQYAMSTCRGAPGRSDTEIETFDYDADDAVGTVLRVLGNAYYPGTLRELEAHRDDRVDEPELLGGGTRHMEYRVALMCDEEPRALGEILHYEAWVTFGIPEIL